ncbi:MAG: hypothetical protein ACRELD_01570 [Longimicrobiales bacterium]
MDIKDAGLLFIMFVVFGAPALALAARLAIRPVVDAIVHLRESLAATDSRTRDRRLAALEAEVSSLGVEVRRLSESEGFSRQLSQATSPEVLAEPLASRSRPQQ